MRPSFDLLFRVMVGVALVALGAPACSGGSAESSSVEILHWWRQGGEAEAIGALLAEFKRQNPGVTIVDASVDGSSLARVAIQNRFNKGSPPDTFQANGGWDLMAWVLYNGTSDVDSKMHELDPSTLDWIDQVPQPVLESVSYKGKVYGVPLNIHRINTLFYNKALFARFGIQPKNLDSLAKVFEAAEMIRQTDPQITPIALGFKWTEGDLLAPDDRWTLSLVFFENILVSRIGGDKYRDLFFHPKTDDAFSPGITNALADFRKLVSYANSDARGLTWSQPLDMVLEGRAAMTIMGDWGKGYANSRHFDDTKFGVMPTPGTAGTFVFTTDTFGWPIGAANGDNTMKLLKVFGSREGQDIFNPIKGSISARHDSMIENGQYDAMAKQTFADFFSATSIVPATSIAAQPLYVDAISAALAEFAKEPQAANPSIVQHTLDNYQDILRSSCWPMCQPPPSP